MILDRLYRAGLRLLPEDYDSLDRDEMWDTYQARVTRASGVQGSSEREPNRRHLATTRVRLRELVDLTLTLLRSRSPLPSLDSIRLDLRDAIRAQWRTPLTSALALGSLAVGLGATSSIFSAVDVWIVRPLPVPNEQRLVYVAMGNRSTGWMNNTFSIRDYVEWENASRTVELMAYAVGSYNFVADGVAERARALTVSANATDVLGVVPVLGRGFLPAEGTTAGDRVVLLSDAFWHESMGANPGVIGSTVVLDGTAHTVVGVLPPGQGIPGTRAEVWTPLRISGGEQRDAYFLRVAGLMRAGTDIDAVRAELSSVAATVADQDPKRTFPDASVRTLRDGIYGDGYEQGGLFLGLASLFVLLIACANIANLLLARGLARTHELAVRGALGASRGRIVQQLLVESAVIGLAGGVLGLGVAYVGIDILLTYGLPVEHVTGWDQIGLDSRIVTGSALLTLLSVFVFGMIPAMRISRVGVGGHLAAAGRDGALESRSKLAHGLVAAEIAASVALVALSGLAIRALTAVEHTDMAMRTSDALVFRLDVPAESRGSGDEITAFYRELDTRLDALPGVERSATSSGHVLSGWSTTLYAIDDDPDGADAIRKSAEYRAVTPSYLDAMGLGMVVGRWLDADLDGRDAPPVALVSRALAIQWWEDPAEALGHSVRYRDERRTIVGVFDPGHIRGPAYPAPPAIFVPFAQAPVRSAFNVVTHSARAGDVGAQVRRVVSELAPSVVAYDVETIEAAYQDALGPILYAVRMLATLGALALGLAVVGVYGVMAHSVGRRMREMGVRMALGANGWSLVRMVLRGNVVLYAVGMTVGIALSIIGGQGLAVVVSQVVPRDPGTLGGVAAALFVVVLVASYLPARRVARADPVTALRPE